MPGTLASLLIKLGLDATGVEQGVARAEKSIGGLSTGAGTAMKVAGSLIGGGLAFAAKGALEMEDRAAALPGGHRRVGRGGAPLRGLGERGGRLVARLDGRHRGVSATSIRTDLGLTGEAADASLDSFLRYERATGQGVGCGARVRRHPRRLEPHRGRHHRDHGHAHRGPADLRRLASPTPRTCWPSSRRCSRAPTWTGSRAPSSSTCSTRRASTRPRASRASPRRWARSESPEELQALLVDIASHADPFERAQKAIDAFGAKAGPKLAQALQASGGDLSRFGFELDEVTGRTEDAAAALDSHAHLEAEARGQRGPRDPARLRHAGGAGPHRRGVRHQLRQEPRARPGDRAAVQGARQPGRERVLGRARRAAWGSP